MQKKYFIKKCKIIIKCVKILIRICYIILEFDKI